MLEFQHLGLYTDHYELTMAQGYYKSNRHQQKANFDYFFRKNPYQGGYVVFAGLSDLLEMITHFRFNDESCQYLKKEGFDPDFVAYLNQFRFEGDIYSVKEGEVIFPNEPVLRIEGNIIETQIVETLVLNVLNFQSLIATKAARVKQVAGERTVIDFGLRRAQGFAGIHASKAAIIGGVESTSNLYSAFRYDLQSTGTQAHSWIQSFDDEYVAFSEFARAYPDRCILLVDTYDTLKSGVPNAIKVAREMEQRGQKLFGVRLDSGDLAYLSKQARKMLDQASLPYVKIAASNQLDEFVIKSLLDQKAPLDAFGVGTNLVTGRNDAALDGVYKLTQSAENPRLKISDNIEKVSLPGIKKIFRFTDPHDFFYGDGIFLNEEQEIKNIHHPHQPYLASEVGNLEASELQRKVMKKGEITIELPSATDSAAYLKQRISKLPLEHLRFENPHVYKVGISSALKQLRDQLIRDIKEKI
ncbi:MAG: nicotinate phosphoribosyltransferase [Candidatus Cyclobacteriaceae bacterium M3_2C_046]